MLIFGKTNKKGGYPNGTKKYFYNVRTHRLHIYGNCRESKQLSFDVKFFNSLDEALAFDGSAVGI